MFLVKNNFDRKDFSHNLSRATIYKSVNLVPTAIIAVLLFCVLGQFNIIPDVISWILIMAMVIAVIISPYGPFGVWDKSVVFSDTPTIKNIQDVYKEQGFDDALVMANEVAGQVYQKS